VRVIEGMDRPDVVFKINMVTTVVNIAGTFILVYWLGFVGAAIATALTIGISMFWNARYVLKFLDVRLPYKEFSYELVSAGIMGVVVWLIYKNAAFGAVQNLILAIVVGAVVYFAVVFSISGKIRSKILTLLRF